MDSLRHSLLRLTSDLYTAWFRFLIRYRKTLLGPAWLVVGPTLFIATLGFLFSEVSGISRAIFMPHLAVGLIVWTLISGFVAGSTTVFQRNRAQLLQGGMQLAQTSVSTGDFNQQGAGQGASAQGNGSGNGGGNGSRFGGGAQGQADSSTVAVSTPRVSTHDGAIDTFA